MVTSNNHNSSASIGAKGEAIAAYYVQKSRGARVLERNVKLGRGEIDIIAEEGKTLVFIEVKTSAGASPGFRPEVHMNASKQRTLRRLALLYLAKRRKPVDGPWRIDHIAVVLYEGEAPRVRYYENAGGEYR